MIGVKDKIWFLREGLFAKYVMSLVGLVVFVLAVNGATETWISYRATKTTLIDAMSEKAEATARRIEQSISELERQISWVTRASAKTYSGAVTLEDHHADYVQLLNQVPAVSQLTLLDQNGRGQLRLSRTTIQVGKTGFAYVIDPKGQVLASSARGPEVARDLSKLPQVAALIRPNGQAPASGTDVDRHAVLTTSNAIPKLGWFVCFEQPTAQALAPIRDQLVRIALLISLGLGVAILAGTVLARRMLVPITALRTGARRLGAGDFSHRIDVHTKDELEELAKQFNSMAGQLHETYSGLESKVQERTRDLAQSINELKVLEEVGRAVASSLDLNAVLPTVASRALEITRADAVLIYGYDAAKRQFNMVEAQGIDRSAGGEHLTIDEGKSILSGASASGEPIAIADLANVADFPMRDAAVEAGFHSVLVVPLV